MNPTKAALSAANGRTDRLPNFPISFFAVVIGLADLTIVWRKAKVVFAPPAVGFISYFNLTGAIDAFARILYYTALLLTLLLAANAMRFLKTKFFLSAWAYSFPLAAMTIATLIMTQQLGGAAFEWMSRVLLAVLTLVVTALFVRTLVAVARREICVEER